MYQRITRGKTRWPRQQVMYQRITRGKMRWPRQQVMYQLKNTARLMTIGGGFATQLAKRMIWRRGRRKQLSPQLQLNERTHHHRIETLAGEGDHGDKIEHAHAEKIFDIFPRVV